MRENNVHVLPRSQDAIAEDRRSRRYEGQLTRITVVHVGGPDTGQVDLGEARRFPRTPAQPYDPDTQPLPDDIQELIRALASARVARRVAICEKLAQLMATDAIDTLRVLADSDGALEVRRAAIKAMAKIGGYAVGQDLVNFLRHEDERTRGQALRGLRDLADPEHLQTLLVRLQNPRFQPRWLLIDAVAAVGDETRCVPPLVSIALNSDEPQENRLRAIGHLGSFDSDPAREALKLCLEDPDPVVVATARAAAG